MDQSCANRSVISYVKSLSQTCCGVWSGGAMVLGKLPVPGRPTSLNDCRARAYCVCNRCEWGLFGHFTLIYLFTFFSLPEEDGSI